MKQNIMSIKKKLLRFFFMLILLLGILNYYSFYHAKLSNERYNQIIDKIVVLNELSNLIYQNDLYLENYLYTYSSDLLLKYNETTQKIKNQIVKIKPTVTGSEAAKVIFKNISNMTQTYISHSNAAIGLKGVDNEKGYFTYFMQSKKVSGYTQNYIKQLINLELSESAEVYKVLSENNKRTQFISGVSIIIAMILSFVFVLWFSKSITKPIEKLVKSAQKISEGDFEIDPIIVESNDEIEILANTFNVMKEDIHDLILEIKGKIELEKNLNIQKMQNLEMKNMLKEIQLSALQSQMNPHFLFNTLNIISKTALLNDGEKTCDLIEALSDILRYNLGKIDKPVMIKDEIEIIQQYFYIQKSRFRDRVAYEIEVEKGTENFLIPILTIQPLVENAFIHGIEGNIQGGKIEIKIYREENHLMVCVIDDGVGMKEEVIKRILDDSERTENENHKGHTTGIGLKNIMKRLRIFYGVEDVFHIQSIENKGTTILLKLPIKRETEGRDV